MDNSLQYVVKIWSPLKGAKVITFLRHPVRSGRDVKFSPGTQLIIESLDSDDPRDRRRLFDLGEAIGRMLYANMVDPSNIDPNLGKIIRQIGRDLTTHWDNDDFDEEFHRGLNWGMQNEHADTVGGLYPEEGKNFI